VIVLLSMTCSWAKVIQTIMKLHICRFKNWISFGLQAMKVVHDEALSQGIFAVQVVPFLRRCTAVLHDHLKITHGTGHSTKALAHVLLALGQLQVPFETVYPLVLAVCDILHDRTQSMDATCVPVSLLYLLYV
jgi:hypothetical protein